MEIAHRAWKLAGGNLFVSVSGGKDSAALAALVQMATGHRVQTAHATSILAMPEARDTAFALAEHLDLPLSIRKPANLRHHLEKICSRYGTQAPEGDITEESLLRAIPPGVDITDPEPLELLFRALSPGNLMVAWTYEAEWEGSYVGLRASESRGRGLFRSIHGPIHRHQSDGKLIACPILDWTVEEVFGWCLEHSLPLHPIYARGIGLGYEPERVRAGDGIVSGWIASQGGLHLVATMYPDWWHRLVAVRPELRQYG